MTKQRIEKAIEIINYAIKNQISVTEASVKCGFADTYVKNVKAVVQEKYENGTLDDELFSMFDEAYKNYQDGSLFAKTKSLEIPPELPKGTNKTTFNSKNENEAEVEWTSSYPDNHIKTLDDLLKACDVDLETWAVKDYQINKWDVTSWKKQIPETIQNFQVKARLERHKKLIDTASVVEIFDRMIKNYEPPVLNLHTTQPFSTNQTNQENNLLEISIFDLHMGKLAWGGETGENYDTKIARKRFMEAVETLLLRASSFNFKRILFPVGNDFFNSDTIFNTTTKGTQQDEDLRWQKTFDVGVNLLVDAIMLLKQTGVPVDVVVIPGNHDFERSYYMGKFLEAWFNKDPQVNVNNGASPRKYYRFGKVLLGLTHGSEEKESSLPLLMATDIESKPLWSETVYHEWHLGHQHRKKSVTYNIIDTKSRTLNEDLGVTIRYLSSLTGTEEWHHKKGFVGQIKAADAFIWNDQAGMIAHLNANISINHEAD